MGEVFFLLGVGFLWILFASIQDLRRREVDNWISFSLIAFVLGFRFFYGLFNDDWNFFYQGLFGFIIFLIVGNLLYYGKMFAGGDAKLMIAVGPLLGLSSAFFINLKIYFLFIILFLFSGAVYGFFSMVFFSLRNLRAFGKDYSRRLKKSRRFIYTIMILGLVFMAIGILENIFFGIGVLLFVFPYFYLYARTVDEVCMVRVVEAKLLTEGDWLYKRVKIGKKFIKPSWQGLSKMEISLIKKYHKEIKIKQGIPFVPVFLIAFLILIYLWKNGLWNAVW
ncbi:prepilin peptidase [Candidatus Pacearchaeota archaeon]|nr:prepilin peptidase [Candidatus Pacearchaeota archaeon]